MNWISWHWNLETSRKHTAWKQECSFRNYFSLFYRYIYEHKFQQAISHPINNTLAKCLSGFQAHQTSVLFPRWESLEHNIVVKVGRSQETTPISKQYFIITLYRHFGKTCHHIGFCFLLTVNYIGFPWENLLFCS